MNDRPIGKTKDQGWEIGVRRTLPVTAEDAWELMITEPGLAIWFGKDADLKLEKGATFQTSEGTTGQIVGFKEGSLLRLRWQPKNWNLPSTLQLRVIPAGQKSTISIHHERLVDGAQRQAMKQHWSDALHAVQQLISKED